MLKLIRGKGLLNALLEPKNGFEAWMLFEIEREWFIMQTNSSSYNCLAPPLIITKEQLMNVSDHQNSL